MVGTLRAQEPALRAMGVSLVAVFGSMARGEATDQSDIDVLVEVDPAKRLSLFDFIGIKHYLDDAIGSPVDLVSRTGVSPSILSAIERDMVRIF
ncbi:MAG: nucleotidyltransferase family protein [Candidatus Eremiobacteraeota bacterium]|nr:nucleotidyltransferase family protein [Candidatus Eremiobacteraeota bacterium]